MRRIAARTALAVAFVLATVVTHIGVSSAATILDPAGSPTVVANAPMTVVATGFAPGHNVFIEQCDGTPSTAQGWDPTLNCDNGASPPPAIADESGRAEFPAARPDRAFRPFQGESPSALFNCVAPRAPAPANSLQTFTNCQLRVSTNNTAATDDQVFRPIVLSGQSVPLVIPTTSTTAVPRSSVPKHSLSARRADTAPRAGTNAGKKLRRGATAPTSTGRAEATVHNADAAIASAASSASTAHSSGGAGLLAVSDGGVAAGYLLVVTGLLLAVLSAFVTVRKRTRAVAPVTPTDTAGERT